MPPSVSVCVLTLSDTTLVTECLASIRACDMAEDLETVVVANGTPSHSLGELEGRDDIVLVRSATNLGFAGGNNLAAAVARGSYLVFINDDSRVRPDCIRRLVEAAGREPSIGAVAARVLSPDGSLQEAGSVLWRDGSTERVGNGLRGDTAAYRHLRDVDFASANGLLVRRVAWDAVGGFDERYFPAYYEDVDLCLALRRLGYRTLYQPQAELVHLESQSTTSGYRHFLLDRNRPRFVQKWRNELERYGEPPDVTDRQAIDRAAHRARGSPPRVLIVLRRSDTGLEAPEADAVEALARSGWVVTLVLDSTASAPQGGALSPAEARLAALGVDVRSELDDAILDVGEDMAAIVEVGDGGSPRPRVLKPDGSAVPSIRVPRGERLRALLQEALNQLPSAVSERDRGRAGLSILSEMADEGERGSVGDRPSDPADGDQPVERPEALREHLYRAERELAAAAAEREVRDEYVAALEKELDETRAILRAKTVYIESLPLVRVKAWILAFRRAKS